MLLFRDVALRLSRDSDVYDSLPWDFVQDYIHLARALKDEIALGLSAHGHQSGLVPAALPLYVHEFLRDALQSDDLTIFHCWTALRDIIWHMPLVKLTPEHQHLFYRYGCRAGCHKNERLGNSYPLHAAVYFSCSSGAYAAYSSSLACTVCHSRYYHNYYVKDGCRIYYGGNVDVVHFEEHFFMDHNLCELFISLMLFSWCPHTWNLNLTLSSEQVWHAFYVSCVIRDHASRGATLVLSNIGDHNSRLKEVLEARNLRIIEMGQPERSHACKACPLRAAVMDGITLGHPCCSIHNCTQPLINNRAHFCLMHEYMKYECSVTDCNAIIPSLEYQAGFRTCSDPDHRDLERSKRDRQKAFFQLRRLLQKQGIVQPADSMDSGTSIAEPPEDEPCDGKPDDGNQVPKIRLGRRRTHNEQLIFCCCGVIAARATMFGAESITGAKDFVKSVCGFKADNMWDILFFDNNCGLQGHVRTNEEDSEFFRRTILCVDVFHFKSKHKTTDEFCQKHCNPAMWTELHDDAGKWHFNSSAAEQGNVWLGGYQAIVRDMLPHRYNFFLDEMIMRRNEVTIRKLEESGMVPYHVPRY
ncbi:hypothetical protein PUNSTDRAFT_76162 [Punctularia strigosozonata HHB-11173 SS5]|uniref:CxC6 like cysteine cluster associated with KDZ domain-containing protein n=1 Tax=Punctularia strigosozonata (strain HHB-11173) TaxID=741275 RepID=R7S418_PUNST|nr:uncharacterized protein PUNSTDRAFT_76162 [Punctularia strigosozonata HHB-11173 SS5]EIN04542.1 hypothetical protein PUNSTDRAFT_76162 [Punctularia strigosozonata HHB-11173 SS5]